MKYLLVALCVGCLFVSFLFFSKDKNTDFCNQSGQEKGCCIKTYDEGYLQIESIGNGPGVELLESLRKKVLVQEKEMLTYHDVLLMICFHAKDFSQENPSKRIFLLKIIHSHKPLEFALYEFTVDMEGAVHISIIGQGEQIVFSS